MKYPVPVPLRACIKGQRAGMTYCDRVIGDREFVFEDGTYAMKVYDARLRPKTPIRVCETCADAVTKRDAKGT